MEIRVLRYFLEIARENNITKAAESLHITQPTLSRQIQQMEEELGVELFDRSSRRLSLTEDGLLLKRRAEEILNLVDKTENELTNEKDKISGVISIGCGEIPSVDEMISICNEFREKYPAVIFNLYTSHASEVLSKIDEGTLDMGLILMYHGRNDSKYEYAVLNKEEEWSCTMREDSELSSKDVITPEDLYGKPLVLAHHWAEGINLVNTWFKGNIVNVNAVYYSNLKTNSMAIIKNSGVYSISTKDSSEFMEYHGIISKPIDPPIKCPVGFAWKKNQPYSRAMNEFINFIKCSKSIKQQY